MGPFGFKEILIIALIIIVLFGAKRIPELFRGVGSGIKEFKDAVKDDEKPKEHNKDNSVN
ncbi:twin-arginine translocase TatA/TatE family subunit [Chryseobacterium taklimakanense]|uniref:twin-arginine translocase TatA/TatE family subunit n=1 Tax=Chryseobacterium taklimakanense TaxID=536441 RepID=UPI000F5E65E3|nr:twin-arginine translocase TatA/TatE family subunit [Chryseobacterium taklimakanense]AZI23429.1 twin-arginine translocase TatA/TatE family subunit [Chryseobacterium taklimakanense]MCG7280481.1 twin-arginine translocase TatA/TatE family subunit [Chryseobacterium taklimakanense]